MYINVFQNNSGMPGAISNKLGTCMTYSLEKKDTVRVRPLSSLAVGVERG